MSGLDAIVERAERVLEDELGISEAPIVALDTLGGKTLLCAADDAWLDDVHGTVVDGGAWISGDAVDVREVR